MNLRILPPEEIMEATVKLPLSKSMSARTLVINHIGGFNPTHPELSDSDDTAALAGGLGLTEGTYNVGAAGTAMRFLTAVCAATPGTDIVLDGNDRMRHRPIGMLCEALRTLGADIEYLGEEGFPPIHIRGQQLHGSELRFDPHQSSQFVTALMMVAPTMDDGLSIHFEGNAPVSLPYIKMTAGMMRNAGIDVVVELTGVHVAPGKYTRPITKIERDWSAASYWYAITAVSAGFVTLADMSMDSVQGDSAMIGLGELIGVNTSVPEDDENSLDLSASPEQHSHLSLDMDNTPDLVQTMVVAAVMLGIPFKFTGVQTLRNKETDRLAALAAEMNKLGVTLEIDGDKSISWDGSRRPIFELPVFDTYGDHRMAMSLVPVSIYLPGIVIRDAEVVSKSYPRFWDDLRDAGFTLLDADREPVDEDNTEE